MTVGGPTGLPKDAGTVRVETLYTHRVPLERLEDGVGLMRTARALKVYVTP